MKKKSIILIILAAILSFTLSSSFFESLLNGIEKSISINSSKPTAQEISEFQSYVADDTYYYYNKLSAEEKEAYEVMYTSVMSFDEAFTMEIPYAELKDVFLAVLYDNPHIFWIDFNYEYTSNENTLDFYPKYTMTKAEAEDMTNKLDKKIDEIVSNIDVSLSDYEKELYIHDYVCENTVYDESTYNNDGHTAYSSLINGKSICEGYSRAVQMLLNEVDVDNYLVVGNGVDEEGEEPHMWNIVTLDGENYHLDATWNDTSGDGEIYYYYYFNVTDKYITRDHTDISPNSNYCTSMKYNYFVAENMYVKSFNGFNEHIERSVDVLRQGENTVEFVFENTEDYKKAVKIVKNDNRFFNYVSECIAKSGRKLDKYQIEYIVYDEENHLSVVFVEK